MTRIARVLAAFALASPLLSACGPQTPGPTVGRVVVAWDEAQHELEEFDGQPPRQLLTTEQEWEAWVESLPTAMQEANASAIEAVVMDDSVLLVAVWNRCTQVGTVVDEGDGAVRFVVHDPEPDTLCAWSPMQVQVWDLPLSQLGVERAEVHLVP
ncbi:hypothetical protein GCM10028820_18450 [Tessaracoccus terricola]